MGLKKFLCECCDCFNEFCSTCANLLCSLSLFAIACCFLGMAMASLFFVIYYVSFFPTTPSASLEHTSMYDYIHENSDFKREVSYDDEDTDEFHYQYDEDPDFAVEARGDEVFRNKRNLTQTAPDPVTSSIGSSVFSTETSGPASSQSPDPDLLSTSKSSETILTEETANHTSTTKKHKFFPGISHTTPTTTLPPEAMEYDPDFTLANVIMDSVYTYSEKADIKTPLGLCRTAADVQVVDYNASLFPADQATEILECINDLLQNQTKKQLCRQLDAEMNAYLKWLVLTGEPREKHKMTNIGPKPEEDSFLFPSSECGKQPPLDQPQCLVDHGFQKHLEKRYESYEPD
uniref:Uncharacterized protein n=1 Tax=Graphocephala atropunctata TaxID=36148 RepID=A0A1B6MQZ7_9HEMI